MKVDFIDKISVNGFIFAKIDFNNSKITIFAKPIHQ